MMQGRSEKSGRMKKEKGERSTYHTVTLIETKHRRRLGGGSIVFAFESMTGRSILKEITAIIKFPDS